MNKITNTLPEQFIDRVKRIVPEELLSDTLNSFCANRPVSFRTNTLKTNVFQLQQKLESEGFELEKVDWYPDAFVLKNKSLKELTDTELYRTGHLYIQSLSSMIPPLVLNPQKNENILDLAAAPGSKTTQLAALMENSGEIIANDISPQRLYRLKSNLEQQGVINTKVTQIPGQLIWEQYPEYFDKVLVDAPCSLEGRINCSEPRTYKDWSLKKVKSLSKRERFLLRSAISATKPGGVIVYSTCTLSPEENEEVIDWILKREKNKIDIEAISINGLTSNEPIMKWKNKTYDPRVTKCLRIFPSKNMEGFFVAKIIKLSH